MKVVCTNLISPATGEPEEDSVWVKVGVEYLVLSVAANPERRSELQILLQNDENGWFDAAMFVTSDGLIPPIWFSRLRDGGGLRLSPKRWLEPGFWELFFDGNKNAQVTYAEDLQILKQQSGWAG